MARLSKSARSTPPATTKTFEAQPWAAAGKMRGSVPPADCMHVCLGLGFLRYLSAAFEKNHAELPEAANLKGMGYGR